MNPEFLDSKNNSDKEKNRSSNGPLASLVEESKSFGRTQAHKEDAEMVGETTLKILAEISDPEEKAAVADLLTKLGNGFIQKSIR